MKNKNSNKTLAKNSNTHKNSDSKSSTKLNSNQNSKLGSESALNADSSVNDILIGQVTSLWAEERGLDCDYRAETSSTNEIAKADCEFAEEALKVYLTEAQTAGRGRNSNSWSNARRGSQLLSTWSMKTEAQIQPTLSPLMGLALYKAASATWPFLPWALKAPNDLYLDSKKVAGILLEIVSQGEQKRIILGLGFNVFDFPKAIATATSLAHALPAKTPLLGEDWISFCDRMIFEFSQLLQRENFGLTTTDQACLLKALNDLPLLDEDYIEVTATASLKTETKTISWMEL